jgi:methionyl aminopeptidase
MKYCMADTVNGGGEKAPEKVEESGDEGEEVEGTATATAAKKKKKKSKKKKGGASTKQSSPPRVGLSKLFPSGKYPEGEIREYTDKYCIVE